MRTKGNVKFCFFPGEPAAGGDVRDPGVGHSTRARARGLRAAQRGARAAAPRARAAPRRARPRPGVLALGAQSQLYVVAP